MALNRMFCGFQPIVLKASDTATAVSPVCVDDSSVASSSAAFSAFTVRSPRLPSAVPWVVSRLSRTKASAVDSTRLVTTWPWRAMELPSPSALPPEEDTLLLRKARMEASSIASISASPSTSTTASSI